MNQFTCTGFLGADPEVRYSQNGDLIVQFSVGTSETRSGKKETEWSKFIAWDKNAERCRDYLKKGSKVLVSGRKRTNKWTTDNGETRSFVEFTLTSVEFLSNKSQDGQEAVATETEAGTSYNPYNSTEPPMGEDVPF